MKEQDVMDIVERQNGRIGGIMGILGEIQDKYGYLSEEVLRMVANKTGRSLVDVFGVATFYGSFRLEPRGTHLVSVCLGTACHVRGGSKVAGEFERQLGIKAGETTLDREFTLEAVNCLGACALGPVAVVDGHYFSNMNPSKVLGVLEKTREGLDLVEIETDERLFPLEVSCARCNHNLMDSNHLLNGFPSIRVTASFGQYHGWLRLSSLYGSYSVETEHEIPKDTIADFFCPHCNAELNGASNCADCRARLVPMIVRGGGVVQICSRRGCRGHRLDVNGMNL